MSNLSDKNARIFVAGGRGMVGSAIVRALRAKGYTNILAPSSSELDLTSQQQTQEWFGQNRRKG